jgi:hypothetical protein
MEDVAERGWLAMALLLAWDASRDVINEMEVQKS